MFFAWVALYVTVASQRIFRMFVIRLKNVNKQVSFTADFEIFRSDLDKYLLG